MSDAISTIQLGVETKAGLDHLLALTAGFKGLRTEMEAFSGAKVGSSALSNELSKAKNEVDSLKKQLYQLAGAQVSSAESGAQAVATAENKKTQAAKQGADERKRIVDGEAAHQKFTVGEGAKFGGTSFSMRQVSDAKTVNDGLRAAAAEKLQIQKTSNIMMQAEAMREVEKRKTAQTMLMAEADRSTANKATAALEREQKALAASLAKTGAAHKDASVHTLTHAAAMNEAHSAARGLLGGLNMMWLSWGSIIPLVAGAAIASSLKNVVEVGKEVEYQLQFVKALSGTGVDLDKFLSITGSTVVSVKEAAEGMRALSQAGLDATDSLRVLPAVLNLAVIGEMSVGAAALSATGVVNAFGLSLSDLERVTDIFAKVAATSNTSVTAMTESMKQASTVGQMFGLTIEEAAASIGVMAQRNIIGGSAGTALTNALTGLYAPTEKAKKALNSLNIETKDSNGGVRKYTDLLEELRMKLSQLNDKGRLEFLETVSTARGAKALNSVIEGFGEYKKQLNAANEASGFAAQGVAILEDTVEGSSKRMKNAMDATFVQSFKNAQPEIQKLYSALGDLAGSTGLVTLLTDLTNGVARLANMIVEHRQGIVLLIEVYVGLKVIDTITTMYKANTAALVANKAAQLAATEAAMMFGPVQMVAATAATRLAGALRLVSASAGWIGLALTALVVVYELFVNKTTDVENAETRHQNSIKTTTEHLEREIVTLQKRNALWNEKEGTFDKPKDVDTSAAQELKSKLLEQREVESKRSKSINNMTAEDGRYKLREVEKKLLKVEREMFLATNDAQVVREGKAITQARETRSSLTEELLKMSKASEDTDSKGNLLGNAKTRKYQADAGAVAASLKAGNISTEIAQKKLTEIKADINKASNDWAMPKKDKSASGVLAQENKAIMEEYRTAEKQAKDQYDYDTQLSNAYYKDKLTSSSEYLASRARDQEKYDSARAAALDTAKSKVDDLKTKVPGDKQATRDALDNEVKHLKNQSIEQKNKDTLAESLKVELDSVKALAEARIYAEKTLPSMADAQKRKEINDVQAFGLSQLTAEEQNVVKAKRAVHDEYEKSADAIRQEISLLDQEIARIRELNELKGGTFDPIIQGGVSTDRGLNATVRKRDALQGSLDKTIEQSTSKQTQAEDVANLVNEQNKWNVALQRTIDLATGMESAFGRTGKSIGDMASAILTYKSGQESAYAAYQAQYADAGGSGIKQEKALAKYRDDSLKSELSSYAKMAGAAKGFFKEKSTGYKVLETVEKGFRAFEMAMEVKSIAMKLFGQTAVTTAVVASSATQMAAGEIATAVSVSQSLRTGAAAVAPAIAKAGSQTGWYGAAAMAVALAALGFASAGAFNSSSGDDMSAEERQKSQGTGTVLGDANAKSESITKSMDDLRDNSKAMLPISMEMLNSLRSIDAAMNGLANILYRTNGITSGNGLNVTTFKKYTSDNDKLSVNLMNDFVKHIASIAMGPGLGGIVDKALSPVIGALQRLWGNTTASITDSGLTVNGSVASLRQGQGVGQYANVQTDTSSWFGLVHNTSNSTQFGAVDAQVSDQIGKVFGGIADTLQVASSVFGKDAATFAAKLSNYIISIPRLSLRGLSGDALQQALNSVFSTVADQMSNSILPGFIEFQKVGEGYFQTVIRVATGVESGRSALEKFGIAAISYTNILNKQGDVGAELVRQSILAVETGSSGVVSGVGKIIESLEGTVADLSSMYKTMLDIEVLMGDTNLNGKNLSSQMILGAGGTSELSSGLSSYLDKFFTPAEKTAAQIKDLTAQFLKLGLTLPPTKTAFRALVDSINMTTDAGAKLAGEVIALANPFAEAMDTATSSLQSLTTSLIAYRDSLVGGSESQLNPNAKKAAAKAALDSNYVLSLVGDLDAIGKMESLSRTYLTASLKASTNALSYALDVAAVRSMVDNVITTSTAQANMVNGSHASGADYIPFDGYRAELHRGEMVLPAGVAQGVRANGGRSDENLEAEMRALRAEVVKLTGYTKRHMDMFTNVTGGGVAMATEEVA